MGLDCSITNRKGCNYCGRRKIINTNGTDFKIGHFTDFDRDEHFIQTINDYGNYYSLDIKYLSNLWQIFMQRRGIK